ncbi:21662_t:CDS:1, partial [Cetraspora pellucida]
NGLRASILSDMLDVRLAMMWLKLLTGNKFWARFEREQSENKLQDRHLTSARDELLKFYLF